MYHSTAEKLVKTFLSRDESQIDNLVKEIVESEVERSTPDEISITVEEIKIEATDEVSDIILLTVIAKLTDTIIVEAEDKTKAIAGTEEDTLNFLLITNLLNRFLIELCNKGTKEIVDQGDKFIKTMKIRLLFVKELVSFITLLILKKDDKLKNKGINKNNLKEMISDILSEVEEKSKTLH